MLVQRLSRRNAVWQQLIDILIHNSLFKNVFKKQRRDSTQQMSLQNRFTLWIVNKYKECDPVAANRLNLSALTYFHMQFVKQSVRFLTSSSRSRSMSSLLLSSRYDSTSPSTPSSSEPKSSSHILCSVSSDIVLICNTDCETRAITSTHNVCTCKRKARHAALLKSPVVATTGDINVQVLQECGSGFRCGATQQKLIV